MKLYCVCFDGWVILDLGDVIDFRRMYEIEFEPFTGIELLSSLRNDFLLIFNGAI